MSAEPANYGKHKCTHTDTLQVCLLDIKLKKVVDYIICKNVCVVKFWMKLYEIWNSHTYDKYLFEM